MAELRPAATAEGPYRFADGRLLFTAPGVARYVCETGRVTVEPQAEAGESDVQALLIATALPAVLWMRGMFVLHAAAAVMPGSDRAIAIAGRSGAGKSSILHRLVERGACAVADDSLAITAAAGATVGSGLPAAYYLPTARPEARDLIAVPPTQRTGAAPVGAILVIDRSPNHGAASLERLGRVEALEQVLQHRHRPRVPFVLGQVERSLDRCAFLANCVPVYRWRRRDGAVGLSDEETSALSAMSEVGGDAREVVAPE